MARPDRLPTGPPSEPTGSRLWRDTGLGLAGTLCSRVLGLVRLAVMAAIFPAATTDAFFVAFTIPNALRVLLGEGAVGGAVIPVLSQVNHDNGEAAARRYLGNVAGALSVLAAGATVVGIATAPWLVSLYAPGHSGEQHHLTTLLTRWTFPYIMVVSLAALATGVLNWTGRFALPAAAPAALNIGLIAGALLLPKWLIQHAWHPALALAIGALTGGVFQLAVQLPGLRKRQLLRWSWPRVSDPDLKKTIALFVPLMAGLGVYQLNILLARAFASVLFEGAQSYLTYAQRIAEIPQGMFAVAVSSASLPVLSKLVAASDYNEVKRTFRHSLRLVLFFAIPATVALALFSEPIVAVFLGRQQFGIDGIRATASALTLMAVGIWAVATVRATVPLFSAFKDTRTPVLASALNLLVFVGVSGSFLNRLEHLAIAAAFSLAAIVQLGALLFFLRRKVGRLGLRSTLLAAGRMVLATVPMAALLWFVKPLTRWSDGASWQNTAVLSAAVLTAMVVYLAASTLLCRDEIQALKQAFRRERSANRYKEPT